MTKLDKVRWVARSNSTNEQLCSEVDINRRSSSELFCCTPKNSKKLVCKGAHMSQLIIENPFKVVVLGPSNASKKPLFAHF